MRWQNSFAEDMPASTLHTPFQSSSKQACTWLEGIPIDRVACGLDSLLHPALGLPRDAQVPADVVLVAGGSKLQGSLHTTGISQGAV